MIRITWNELPQGKAAVLADASLFAGWQSTLHTLIDNLEDEPTARARLSCRLRAIGVAKQTTARTI